MANPVLTEEATNKFIRDENSLENMSIAGTVVKTLFLLAITVASAAYTFSLVLRGFFDKALLMGQVGVFGGLIVVLVVIFSQKIKWIAPLSVGYSAFEGLAIGGISAVIASSMGTGIVLNAASGTFAALFLTLFLYSAKIIRPTEKFRSTIVVAMLAILAIYIVNLILILINPQGAAPVLMGSSPIGIGFSIFVCIIAALNFIIDFGVIEDLKDSNLSKDFEWYGAFSLIVTIIWLYVEILNLLAKLNSKR